MAEHGRPFSDEMVRAIMAKHKTRTMRPVSWRNSTVDGHGIGHRGPMKHFWDELRFEEAVVNRGFLAGPNTEYLSVPRYEGCDRLVHRVRARISEEDTIWVREAHHLLSATSERQPVLYRASNDRGVSRWTPSIHMPRSAARLLLLVTSVYPQRPSQVSPSQALAEGIEHTEIGQRSLRECHVSPDMALRELLARIYGPGYRWYWVYEWSEVQHER